MRVQAGMYTPRGARGGCFGIVATCKSVVSTTSCECSRLILVIMKSYVPKKGRQGVLVYYASHWHANAREQDALHHDSDDTAWRQTGSNQQ
eukprot:6491313-Amphidinium_carterae.3